MNNDQTKSIVLPYGEVVPKLIASVMRAQLEFVRAIRGAKDVESGVERVGDDNINKHFRWLLDERSFGKEGVNRHVFDAPDPDWSAILGLREKKRSGPTRITLVIRNSFRDCEWKGPGERSKTGASPGQSPIKMISPLRVARDILTDPEAPGTQAYATLTLRNLLFETFDVFPKMWMHTDRDSACETFTVNDVAEALGYVWTSFRERRESRGADPLPPAGKKKIDTVVRAWLTLKGIARLHFRDIQDCEKYLASGNFAPWRMEESSGQGKKRTLFEVQKIPHLRELPDVGRIVNELWGLFLPIRGAETLFQGGLKFPESGGLVMAVHGDPGAGKTSLALALGAYLAPLGIKTLFITADGETEDLRARMTQLVSDRTRRLSFFPGDLGEWVFFERIRMSDQVRTDGLRKLIGELRGMAESIRRPNYCQVDGQPKIAAPLPCDGIVVLDGLHDLFAATEKQESPSPLELLYDLIDACRRFKMLVIFTSGGEWQNNPRLDYLVDVVIGLKQESIDEYGAKPDRRVTLTKTRHQFSALGIHGFRLDGQKGVRFSPQINYRLDDRSIFDARLPDISRSKDVLSIAAQLKIRKDIPSLGEPFKLKNVIFERGAPHLKIYPGSHVFINGRGSSGKAGLALKIAVAPTYPFRPSSEETRAFENVLIISFLYPREYYENLFARLIELRRYEYLPDKPNEKDAHSGAESAGPEKRPDKPAEINHGFKVIHLYPGHLRPNDLFNRIEWELDAAVLRGLPYAAVVIDGLHNVHIQFPEIEKYNLLWPQLYASLRTRDVTVITTHTTLAIPDAGDPTRILDLDDRRSEPLRHALVQKTDFQFEIDPFASEKHGWAPESKVDAGDKDHSSLKGYETEGLFVVRTMSAIGQVVPTEIVLWSRNQLVFFRDPRPKDPKVTRSEGRKGRDERQMKMGL